MNLKTMTAKAWILDRLIELHDMLEDRCWDNDSLVDEIETQLEHITSRITAEIRGFKPFNPAIGQILPTVKPKQ